MQRDDIIQASVIAVGGSATGFALTYMVKFGVSQESLFALLGSLIGAAATIGGAAWLADHNRLVDKNAEVALLAKEYGKLLRATQAAQMLEPGYGMPWPKEYRPKLSIIAEIAGDTHLIGDEALLYGKALSFIHRAAVRRVQFVIDEYLLFWTDSNAEGDLDPMDDRSFPEMTASITHECKITIAKLNGTIPFSDEV